jgi:peptide subunit release factor RF-3
MWKMPWQVTLSGFMIRGTYQVGDTLTTGQLKVEFEPLPTFTPELFMKVFSEKMS